MTIIEELRKELSNLDREIRKITPPEKRAGLFLILEKITALVNKIFIEGAPEEDALEE